MKKFSFFTSMTALALCVAFVFAACKKEQTSTSDTVSSESNSVSGLGTTIVGGNVSNAEAASLLAEYLKTAGPNESQYVEFSIADLQAYLNAMKSKYKSDKVYVNFGVYNATTATNPAYIGRKTVFFSVNNNKKTTAVGNLVGLTIGDGGDGDSTKNQFNHGSIYP